MIIHVPPHPASEVEESISVPGVFTAKETNGHLLLRENHNMPHRAKYYMAVPGRHKVNIPMRNVKRSAAVNDLLLAHNTPARLTTVCVSSCWTRGRVKNMRSTEGGAHRDSANTSESMVKGSDALQQLITDPVDSKCRTVYLSEHHSETPSSTGVPNAPPTTPSEGG